MRNLEEGGAWVFTDWLWLGSERVLCKHRFDTTATSSELQLIKAQNIF